MWLVQRMSPTVFNASGHSFSLREAYASSQTIHGPAAKMLAMALPAFFPHNSFPKHCALQRIPVSPLLGTHLGHKLEDVFPELVSLHSEEVVWNWSLPWALARAARILCDIEHRGDAREKLERIFRPVNSLSPTCLQIVSIFLYILNFTLPGPGLWIHLSVQVSLSLTSCRTDSPAILGRGQVGH